MNTTRKIIISIFIGLFFISSYAQELKTKKISNDFYSEIFTIDKESKIKNGAYVKISLKNKDTLISGTYRDGIKTGIWKFNDADGQPWISYDYNKKILDKVSGQLSNTDSFLIKKDDAFILEKVDCPPVYLGFKNEFGDFSFNFHIPVEIMQEGTSIFSIASFIVDKSGKMKDFEIVVPSTDELNIRIQNAFKKIDGEWTSAVFRGQPVESMVFVVFDIKHKDAAVSTIPKVSNAIIVKMEYYGVTYKKSSTVVSSPSSVYRSPVSTIRKY
jgi:hypothetical protein